MALEIFLFVQKNLFQVGHWKSAKDVLMKMINEKISNLLFTAILLKVHCVIFRMIHRQKCNIIYITTFSEEYKDLT